MMGSWQPTTLRELLKVEHGFAFKGEYFSESGHYVLLTPGNFYEEGGFKPRPGKDRYYVGEIPERYILPKGSMIVAMTEQAEGLLGSPAIIPESNRYLHNQRLGLVLPHPGQADLSFLYHLFNTNLIRQQLRNSSSGAKVRHTSPERIYRAEVTVPDVPTQRKIAAILTAYDDLIETNKRRIALLEKMAEELYREWFVRMRFPGHEKTKFAKGVPEDWTAMPSSEMFEVLSGGTPKTDVPSYWDGHIPFFTPKDAPDNVYVSHTEKWITEKGLSTCNSRLYPKHTIFITARGTVGKLALAQCEMAMNQSCYALAPKFEQKVYFFYLAMLSAINVVKGVSKSGVFDNIIVDTFKIIPIYYPGEGLINSFNELAEPIFSQLESLLLANMTLNKARDLLLPRLISGKLSVEDLDIQFPSSMQ